MNHRLDAGERRQRRDENFVARLKLAGHGLGDVEQMDCRRPRRREHNMPDAKVSRQFLLERLALGPEDVVAALDDFENTAVDGF